MRGAVSLLKLWEQLLGQEKEKERCERCEPTIGSLFLCNSFGSGLTVSDLVAQMAAEPQVSS